MSLSAHGALCIFSDPADHVCAASWTKWQAIRPVLRKTAPQICPGWLGVGRFTPCPHLFGCFNNEEIVAARRTIDINSCLFQSGNTNYHLMLSTGQGLQGRNVYRDGVWLSTLALHKAHLGSIL